MRAYILLVCVCLGALTACQKAPDQDTEASTSEPTILGSSASEWIDWHNERANENAQCSSNQMNKERVLLHDFDVEYYLLEIQCNTYAYQGDYVFYAIKKADEATTIKPKRLTFEIQSTQGEMVSDILLGAVLFHDTKQLATFQKYQGAGSCGSASLYDWDTTDGAEFVLIEAREKPECDGDVNAPWPVIYKK